MHASPSACMTIVRKRLSGLIEITVLCANEKILMFSLHSENWVGAGRFAARCSNLDPSLTFLGFWCLLCLHIWGPCYMACPPYLAPRYCCLAVELSVALPTLFEPGTFRTQILGYEHLEVDERACWFCYIFNCLMLRFWYSFSVNYLRCNWNAEKSWRNVTAELNLWKRRRMLCLRSYNRPLTLPTCELFFSYCFEFYLV